MKAPRMPTKSLVKGFAYYKLYAESDLSSCYCTSSRLVISVCWLPKNSAKMNSDSLNHSRNVFTRNLENMLRENQWQG